jgi:hypothetical protein
MGSIQPAHFAQHADDPTRPVFGALQRSWSADVATLLLRFGRQWGLPMWSGW